jgi:hypothetical protein
MQDGTIALIVSAAVPSHLQMIYIDALHSLQRLWKVEFREEVVHDLKSLAWFRRITGTQYIAL